MGRPSKRATKIRKASEFDGARLSAALRVPIAGTGNVYAWELSAIYDVRNQQMAGKFALPARLADSMRTDDALFVAYKNRLAPMRSLSSEIKASGKSALAKRIASEADAAFGEDGACLSLETILSTVGCLVNHGVAFTLTTPQPRDDGSRVDFFVSYWPIEFVRWDSVRRQFMARVDPSQQPLPPDAIGSEVPIVHGDGRWTIYAEHEHEPWKHGVVVAAALVWAAHAFALRDWAKGSAAHGNAKVVGELPQGIALQDGDGSLSPEAAAFIELLKAIVTEDAPAGIAPAGSKVNYLVNSSTAWQVWSELGNNREKAAARVYLGTDGILGAQGGAPGVDLTKLLGVATTLVQGDVGTFSKCFRQGVIEPWTAVNFGDSTLAPSRVYMLPDGDEDTKREGNAKKRQAFYADIEKAKELGFVVDQEYVNDVATIHGVDAPTLPAASAAAAPSIALAPTDIASVVRVNEARASAGLGPMLLPDGSADPDGLLTIDAFKAKNAAVSASNAAGPPTTSQQAPQ